MLHENDTLKSITSGNWILPMTWCAATTVIIAAGLIVPFGAGPPALGFDYLFVAGGHDAAFVQSLAVYAVAAAALGAAFMFIPKATNWRFRKGMAWAAFILMVVGGMMMLIVPQLLRWLVSGSEGPVIGAAAWSVVWMDLGARISIAGGLAALATFFDAWLRRGA
jgi:hypothetical protein